MTPIPNRPGHEFSGARPPTAGWAVGAVLLAAAILGGAGCGTAEPADRATAERWRVYSIEYGHSKRYKKSALLRGAAKDARVPLAWCAWLVRSASSDGRQILIDTGFVVPPKRPPERLDRVDALLAGLKLAPAAITDVVVTHLHWDHAGNLAPYERARIWLQQDSVDWASSRVSPEKPKVGGLRLADLRAIERARESKRLTLIDGNREIAPGVILHRGGGHVPGLQWVEVRTGGPAGTVILASDVAYLYENLERRVASGATRTPDADLKLYDEMLKLASRPALVIPGHDPEVARRFDSVAPHIVEIK